MPNKDRPASGWQNTVHTEAIGLKEQSLCEDMHNTWKLNISVVQTFEFPDSSFKYCAIQISLRKIL